MATSAMFPPTRRRWLVVALAVVAVVAAIAGARLWLAADDPPLDPLEPVPAGSLLAVPPSGPVIVIMLENKNERSILDATDAPYLQSLFDTGAVATEYQAVAHPSEPNYLALFSGSTQGVTDNGSHDLNAPTIADQLENAGKTDSVIVGSIDGGCAGVQAVKDGKIAATVMQFPAKMAVAWVEGFAAVVFSNSDT